MEKTKLCLNCYINKNILEFAKHGSTEDKLQQCCKTCQKIIYEKKEKIKCIYCDNKYVGPEGVNRHIRNKHNGKEVMFKMAHLSSVP